MNTTYQIKKIEQLKALTGISFKEFQRILASFDVCDAKDLTQTEADIIISILDEKLKAINFKHSDILLSNDQIATPLQLKRIEYTWQEICNNKSKEHIKKTLSNYLKTHFKVYNLQLLTKARAGRIISVLDKILKRKLLKTI